MQPPTVCFLRDMPMALYLLIDVESVRLPAWLPSACRHAHQGVQVLEQERPP
jgi:hypothetical protein